MNRKIIESKLSELTKSIEICLDAKLQMPALILMYCTIDILSSLNRPKDKEDSDRKEFISWVARYLLPKTNLNCKAKDLYAARCGLVHTYTPESQLNRHRKAKKIFYAWGAQIRNISKNGFPKISLRFTSMSYLKHLKMELGYFWIHWNLNLSKEK